MKTNDAAEAAKESKPSQFRDAIKKLDESIDPGIVICRGLEANSQPQPEAVAEAVAEERRRIADELEVILINAEHTRYQRLEAFSKVIRRLRGE